jgi:hypothetical protein
MIRPNSPNTIQAVLPELLVSDTTRKARAIAVSVIHCLLTTQARI